MQSKSISNWIAAALACGLLVIAHVAHQRDQARLVLVEQSGDVPQEANDASQPIPSKKVLYSAQGLAYPAKAEASLNGKGKRFFPGSGMFSTDPRMVQKKEKKGTVRYSSQGLGYAAEPKASTNTRFLSGSGMYSTDVRFRHAKIQQKTLQTQSSPKANPLGDEVIDLPASGKVNDGDIQVPGDSIESYMYIKDKLHNPATLQQSKQPSEPPAAPADAAPASHAPPAAAVAVAPAEPAAAAMSRAARASGAPRVQSLTAARAARADDDLSGGVYRMAARVTGHGEARSVSEERRALGGASRSDRRYDVPDHADEYDPVARDYSPFFSRH